MNIDWVVFKDFVLPLFSLGLAVLAIFASILQIRLSAKIQEKNRWIEELRINISEYLSASVLAMNSYRQYLNVKGRDENHLKTDTSIAMKKLYPRCHYITLEQLLILI